MTSVQPTYAINREQRTDRRIAMQRQLSLRLHAYAGSVVTTFLSCRFTQLFDPLISSKKAPTGCNSGVVGVNINVPVA